VDAPRDLAFGGIFAGYTEPDDQYESDDWRDADSTYDRGDRGWALVVVMIGLVIAIGLVLVWLTEVQGSDDRSGAARSCGASARFAATIADGTVACSYTPDTSGNPNLQDLGTPHTPEATPSIVIIG
jgi:hypothetical protein